MISQPLHSVICVLNSKYIHSSLAPWCLLAGVKAYCCDGITAEVAEGTVNENIEEIARRIAEKNPQVIGFSCYIWNIDATRRLLRIVKSALPDAVIVLGGPEAAYCPETLLQEEPGVNFVITGEGERPFALLLDALAQGSGEKGIPGVSYRLRGQVIVNPPGVPDADPPDPYVGKYFDTLGGRIAYLETSRGCPYSCAFCLSGRCGGARFFDLDRAKQNLLRLANSGAKTVKLVDRTFNANRKRAAELFRFILEHYGREIPQGVCFHFEIAGDLLEEETLGLLSAAPAGSIQLEIGLQSFNEKTLAAVGRKTDTGRLRRNIQRLVDMVNLHIHIDLIAGLPYEDLNSFAESFTIAYRLHPHMLQLGFLKLLHGAPMRENPGQFPCEYAKSPPYEVTATPWLAADELLLLHHMEDAVDRLYNSGRFRRTLQYLLEQSRDTPFALFRRFGEYAAGRIRPGISLDEYTAGLFEYWSGQPGIDQAVLRDLLVCDRISTNSSGRLPPVLYRRDPALRSAVKALEQNAPSPKGVKRGYALLYSEPSLIYAEYRDRNPVTGEYPLVKAPLENREN